MDTTSEKLSILAFYLSEYDMAAVEHLGYSSRNEAFLRLSQIFGRPNNYLKLRRDEFDALPESSSSRRGYANRPAIRSVIELAKKLHGYTFEELSLFVDTLIENEKGMDNLIVYAHSASAQELSEDALEQILNAKDDESAIIVRTGDQKVRKVRASIIQQLKKLYSGKCQICGERPKEDHGIDICEAHHIIPFAISQNNNSSNIIILCPNHHRLIHKLNPVYDNENDAFVYSDGTVEQVKLRIIAP